jgi:hypothetical protein
MIMLRTQTFAILYFCLGVFLGLTAHAPSSLAQPKRSQQADWLFKPASELLGVKEDAGVTRDARFPQGYGWGGQTVDTNKENCARAKQQFASPPCSNKCTAIATGGFNVGNVMGTIGGFLGGGSGGSIMSTVMSAVGNRGSVPESCQATCQFLQLNCDGRLADAYKKLYDRCERAIDDRKKEEDNYLKSCSALGVSNCVESINRCQNFLSARTAAEMNAGTNPGNMNQLYMQNCPHLACAEVDEQKEIAGHIADDLKEVQENLRKAQDEVIQAHIRNDLEFAKMRDEFLTNERNIVERGNQLARDIQEASENQEKEIMKMSNDIANLEFENTELMNVDSVKIIQDLDSAYADVDNECRAKASEQMEKERAVIKERTKTGEGVSHLSMMRAQLYNLESEMSDAKEGFKQKARARCMRGRGAWFKIQKAEQTKLAGMQSVRNKLARNEADQKRLLKQLELLAENFEKRKAILIKQADDDVKYLQALRVELQNKVVMKNQIVMMETQSLQQKVAALQMQLEQAQYAQRLQCTQWPMLAACSANGGNTSGALAKVQGLGSVKCPKKDSNKDYSEVVTDLQKLLKAQTETAGRCCTIANDGKLDPTVEPFVYEAQQACVVGRQNGSGLGGTNSGTQGVK